MIILIFFIGILKTQSIISNLKICQNILANLNFVYYQFWSYWVFLHHSGKTKANFNTVLVNSTTNTQRTSCRWDREQPDQGPNEKRKKTLNLKEQWCELYVFATITSNLEVKQRSHDVTVVAKVASTRPDWGGLDMFPEGDTTPLWNIWFNLFKCEIRQSSDYLKM